MNFWSGRAPNKHIAKAVRENERFKELLTDSPWRNKPLLEAYMFILSGTSDPTACFTSKRGDAAIASYLKSRRHVSEVFESGDTLNLSGYGYVLLEDRQMFFKDYVVAARWCEFRITLSHLKEPTTSTGGVLYRRLM